MPLTKVRAPEITNKPLTFFRIISEKCMLAVARKLAVILHRMWIDETEFN